MKRTVIVGVGSPFGDDRAGWLVIETLAALLDDDARAAAGITLAALDRPGAALLEHLRDAERAVLIDAVRGGGAAGAVLRLDVAQLQSGPSTSSHGFGVAETLALGAALNVLPAELLVFGLVIDEARAEGTDVSAAVREGAAQLADELRRRLADPTAQ